MNMAYPFDEPAPAAQPTAVPMKFVTDAYLAACEPHVKICIKRPYRIHHLRPYLSAIRLAKGAVTTVLCVNHEMELQKNQDILPMRYVAALRRPILLAEGWPIATQGYSAKYQRRETTH